MTTEKYATIEAWLKDLGDRYKDLKASTIKDDDGVLAVTLSIRDENGEIIARFTISTNDSESYGWIKS